MIRSNINCNRLVHFNDFSRISNKMSRLLLCFAIFAFCSSANSADPSVIIVGAGPAGIAAATRLLENGISNIKIFEAEDRVGGRVKTVSFGDSYIDEGAQYCHGQEGNVVYEMVKDLDLLQPSDALTDLTAKLYYSNGSTLDPTLTHDLEEITLNYDDFEADYDITGKSLGEAYLDKYNSTILQTYINDPEKLKIVLEGIRFSNNLILMHEGAFSWDTPAAGRHYTACEGNQMQSWKIRGYGIIFDILTKAYPDPSQKLPIDDKIILNTTVSEISWNDDGATVKTDSGAASYSADYIIFTPSVGVLRDNQDSLFVPQLPQSKKEAIAAFGFDGIMKLVMHFPEKWWNDDDSVFYFLWSDTDFNNIGNEFSEGPSKDGVNWVAHIVALVQVEADPNSLIAWVSSDLIPEMEQTSEDVLQRGAMYVLDKFLGQDYNITEPDQLLRSQWVSNPNFKGTYSFEKTGYYQDDVHYQSKLAEPLTNSQGHPMILFAGEATHDIHYSTVHGAIETGYREADRIISLHKKQ